MSFCLVSTIYTGQASLFVTVLANISHISIFGCELKHTGRNGWNDYSISEHIMIPVLYVIYKVMVVREKREILIQMTTLFEQGNGSSSHQQLELTYNLF
jgi:hypothetical protein